MAPNEKDIDWRVRVFDSLSYPTRILQPDGTIIAVNDIFLESIGELSDSFIGQSCRKANKEHFPNQSFPCDDDERCPLCKALKTKTGQSVLLHTVEPDGEDRWEDRVFSPILGDNGEVKYVIESIRDVTRVKILEKLYNTLIYVKVVKLGNHCLLILQIAFVIVYQCISFIYD